MNFEDIYKKNPYELSETEKEDFIIDYMKELSVFHYNNCNEYRKLVDGLGFNIQKAEKIEELPYLPVRLFKTMDLCSVEEDEVIKIMTSSGTTGTNRSRIFLDRETATNQQRVMIKIISDFIGKKRLPMLIIDSKEVLKKRQMMAVRGAAILGFSIAGTKRFFALDENMNVNVDGIRSFIQENMGEKILIFGFTSMIWQYFYNAMKDGELNLENSVLIHGGGWKKLESQKVNNESFKKYLGGRFGIRQVYDYYGMVEQTGCIYVECEYGHLHVSNFSDVIIRRKEDFTVAEKGEEGIVQVVSTIPKSYPGHSILTEDRGVLVGSDNCLCGRKGKYIRILGRIKNAEIRGCSDVY